MTKKRLTVSRRKGGEAAGERALKLGERAGRSLAQLGLEFGEGHFDGVKVRAVSGQIAHGGAVGGDQLGHARDFVRGEIVQDDHVASLEFRTEDMAQVSGEDLGIDCSLDEERCRQTVAA